MGQDNPKPTLDRAPAVLRNPVFSAPCTSTSEKPPKDQKIDILIKISFYNLTKFVNFSIVGSVPQLNF